MKRITQIAPLLLLAACGTSDNAPGPGGVSVGEARALDEAASMIEARRLPGGGGKPADGLPETGMKAAVQGE